MLARIALILAWFTATSVAVYAEAWPVPADATYTVPLFRFADGETLRNLRLHYVTLGRPHRNAEGHVDNAVLILHGTGGDTGQFLRDRYAGVLFVPGGLLDATKYFIVITDGIGHGKSSKPSDGLRAHFPHYGYHDMVTAQHLVVADALHYDANDLIYQLEASRDYDPEPSLGTIVAPLLAINSGDDQINPPELGIVEREIHKVKQGRFVLLPITPQTRGHGTHTYAAIWQSYLGELLDTSGGRR